MWVFFFTLNIICLRNKDSKSYQNIFFASYYQVFNYLEKQSIFPIKRAMFLSLYLPLKSFHCHFSLMANQEFFHSDLWSCLIKCFKLFDIVPCFCKLISKQNLLELELTLRFYRGILEDIKRVALFSYK